MKRIALALLLLAGCQRGGGGAARSGPPDLETAAISAGLVPNPDDSDVTGLYARDTDRICLVPAKDAYRAGVTIDYGDGQGCAGSGTATRAGATVHFDLDRPGCSFDARFDGDRIVFPAQLPDACRKQCAGRASLEALDVERLSESVSEASTLRDPRGRLLCGG